MDRHCFIYYYAILTPSSLCNALCVNKMFYEYNYVYTYTLLNLCLNLCASSSLQIRSLLSPLNMKLHIC